MLIAAKILLIALFITLTLILLVLTFLARPISEALKKVEIELANFRDSFLMKSNASTLHLLLPLLSNVILKLLDHFMLARGKSLLIKAGSVIIIVFKAADAFFKAFLKYTQVKSSLKR